jgi:hypothetical protein
MTHRKSMLIGVGLVSLIGVSIWAQTPARAPQPQCSLAQKGSFDLGWTEKATDGSYRCMATFDAAWKASGAAWIKVNADGTVGVRLPQ